MKRFNNVFHHRALWALAALLVLASCADMPAQRSGSVERLYVLYCGEGTAPDRSRWSPGVDVGKPITLANSCYLIKHAKGWMLWETGFNESIAGMKDGMPTPVLHWRWTSPKTLTAQLAELGLKPADIAHVGFSHAHPDHIGNGSLFAAGTLYIQQAEYDFYLGPKGKPPGMPADFDKLRTSKHVMLNGDHDIFGDGSVMIISTPGHTPGHQSLLLKLPRTGAVLLTGDAAHFQENYAQRRSPVQNFNREQTLQSMDKIASVAAASKAQIWINHDVDQTAKLKKAPAYIE
jgi:glyoxylase-like metal-dependent hydrolase (beta-lactamase superfamily II)